jgi:SAM-dependent methyltransferase
MPATTWGLGDYPRMAELLMPVARDSAELLDVTAADRVLDVACGTGNAAVAAAERGAQVVGVDFEPKLLDIARERAPTVEFIRGDAAKLPFADAEFSVVLSVFGVMYAPDHEQAARELARVAKPGALIALAAWAPGSLMPAMGAALAPYLPPPPPGSGPPSRWGDEPSLRAILDAAGIKLEVAVTGSLPLDADVDFLIDTAGHVLAERERLEQEGRWQDLRRDLEAVVDARPAAQYLLAGARR